MEQNWLPDLRDGGANPLNININPQKIKLFVNLY